VAVKGGSLHRRGEPRGRRVDFRGGAKYPEGRQSALVLKEKLEWREAGLDGQDVSGGTREALGCPPLDLMPECGELPSHVDGGQKGVRAIAEDGDVTGALCRKTDPKIATVPKTQSRSKDQNKDKDNSK